MKLLSICVDKLPKSCLYCVFNKGKYCTAIMATDKRNNAFVNNNRKCRNENCPLKVSTIK